MAISFPRELYRLRNLAETVISVMKRKLGDLAPGHTIHMQCKQALLAGLTYNLHLLKYALSWPLPTLRPAS